MKDILLNILAILAIFSSVLVITSKNPVISVLYLIAVFVNTAGYLILSGLGFLGIAYIIVYIGAITVLFLFVIMMINIKLTDILEVGREYTKNLPLGLSIGFVFLYEILSILSSGPSGLNNITLQILNYPLELLTIFNKLFMFIASPSDYLNSNILNNFVVVINTIVNPTGLDINFVNFLQIEMLGQGLYTYGATWLILSSLILLLSRIAPIILSSPSNSNNNN